MRYDVGRLGQSQAHLFAVSRCSLAQSGIGRRRLEQGADERDLFGAAQTNGLVFLFCRADYSALAHLFQKLSWCQDRYTLPRMQDE